MDEKCFCHLNGYAVKDAKARGDLEDLKTDVSDLHKKVGVNYIIRSNIKGQNHPKMVASTLVGSYIFFDRFACSYSFRSSDIDRAQPFIEANEIQNAHFVPFNEETWEGYYNPAAYSVSVNPNGSSFTINTVGEDFYEIGVAMSLDSIATLNFKPYFLMAKVKSGSFESSDGELHLRYKGITLTIKADEDSYIWEYAIGPGSGENNILVVDTYDSNGNPIIFNNLVLDVYIGTKGFNTHSTFPDTIYIDREGVVTSQELPILSALSSFAKANGVDLEDVIWDENYDRIYNYIDVNEKELAVNVVRDEAGNKIQCEERRISVEDVFIENDYDGSLKVQPKDKIYVGGYSKHSSYIDDLSDSAFSWAASNV